MNMGAGSGGQLESGHRGVGEGVWGPELGE